MNQFEKRLAVHAEELKALHLSLYGDDAAYEELVSMLRRLWADRRVALRRLDAAREANPDWYRDQKLLGMMLYTNCFAGNLQGVEKKLPYLQECGVNYLHLMPLLESPKGRSDGGYAVSDFRKVQPELGTVEDLCHLTEACRKRKMCVCLDFVMNHTSEDHEWAQKARAGVPGYRERYFFYDDWDIPREFEKTVPQVFPTTAPGSFTELPDCGQVVMTNFYPYQWDLNYANPVVFRDMAENLLFLTNCGIDVIRLDAVPYIWKELGTSCRNLPQVHTLTRMMRLVCEIVCPGVLLLGEVVMEPSKVAPYFGSENAPECHMLYNVTTMATTWHTLATADVTLLRRQLDAVSALPRDFLFLNYLRCHDDIGWGLDYPFLAEHFGIEEGAHKKYLNDWFTGKWEGSVSRGELYNDDPRLRDARLCGTTASLCGLQTADSPEQVNRALSCDLMLHAWMLSQSGIPVLYSGDEIGQLNDETYHLNPEKCEDSRYLHRGSFPWDRAEHRMEADSVPAELFSGLRRLETIRAEEPCFRADACIAALDTGNSHVLGVSRSVDGRELICLYNFSADFAPVRVERDGVWQEQVFGYSVPDLRNQMLYPYGCAWLLRDC